MPSANPHPTTNCVRAMQMTIAATMKMIIGSLLPPHNVRAPLASFSCRDPICPDWHEPSSCFRRLRADERGGA